MRKIFTILLTFFLVLQVVINSYAIDSHANASAYNHLSEINKQWQEYTSAAPTENTSFRNDLERIQ